MQIEGTLRRARSVQAWSPSPRTVDIALCVASLALTVLAVKTPWSTLPRPVIAAAGVIGSAALLGRRRYPVTVAVVGIATQILSGNPWPQAVGLFTAAQNRTAGFLVGLIVFGSAAGVGAEAVAGDGVSDTDVLGCVLIVVVPVGVGIFAGTRRQLMKALQDRAEQAESERRLRDEQARSAERTRIAREMHDLLAHEVSLIAIQAGALEVSADAGRDRVVEVAGLIRATAHGALTELRTVLGVLRSTGVDGRAEVDDPFADVAGLVTSWRGSGADVTLVDEAGPLPQDLSRTVHRIVREGLTNAAKHAAGQPVTVNVTGCEDRVRVTVVNHPAGGTPGAPTVDPAITMPGTGFGLVGLAERCRLAGGSLNAGPRVDSGWQLVADLPRSAAS
jgi:signal transduction histidine kinase